MNKKHFNGFKIMLAAAVTVLAMAALTACGSNKKSITVEVTSADGTTTTYTGKTDAETLHDAIDDVDGVTLDGYDSDYGFYITAVNGETADFDTDGAYWSIYVNGEYGQYGVDSQPVTDGDVYTFAYEVYVAQ